MFTGTFETKAGFKALLEDYYNAHVVPFYKSAVEHGSSSSAYEAAQQWMKEATKDLKAGFLNHYTEDDDGAKKLKRCDCGCGIFWGKAFTVVLKWPNADGVHRISLG